MCIVGLITQYCARVPLILIGNRDEILTRLTHPLAVDSLTNLLWSVDGVAGGSWLGLDLAQGRLATVTNCRRVPTAPLLFTPEVAAATTAVEWRGAAPLEEAKRHNTVVEGLGGLATLNYDPPTSRGNIIKDYLTAGTLPGDDAAAAAAAALPRTLWPPYYAGYNLLSCDHVFAAAADGAPMVVDFTTNRYGAQRKMPLAPGVVHVLQNTYMDNWAEPKSCCLADRLREVLEREVAPLAADGAAPLDVEKLSTALADHCLSATPHFDLMRMIQDIRGREDSTPAERAQAAAWEELLSSSDPLLGWTEEELATCFRLPDLAPAQLQQRRYYEQLKEAHLQRNICVPAERDYGTRVQSVVVVERPSLDDTACVVHFAQREVVHVQGKSAEEQHTLSAKELFEMGAWKRYAVTAKEARAC